MTLDEVIEHAEEVAEEKQLKAQNLKQCKDYGNLKSTITSGVCECETCAEEHRQLAEWLKDYKRLKEQKPCEDAISRKAAIDVMIKLEQDDIDRYGCKIPEGFDSSPAIEVLDNLPSITSQPKIGHWIEIAQYSDAKHKIECSECGNHIIDRGHANSFNVKNKYKYCPNCGCRMESEDNG